MSQLTMQERDRKRDLVKTFTKIAIRKQREIQWTEPEKHSDDLEELGTIVSNFTGWDIDAIMKCFKLALEDANAAELLEKIEALEKEFWKEADKQIEDFKERNAPKEEMKFIGEDDWGRKVYTNGETQFKDVDGVLHTTTLDGEPDCPVAKEVEVIIGGE